MFFNKLFLKSFLITSIFTVTIVTGLRLILNYNIHYSSAFFFSMINAYNDRLIQMARDIKNLQDK